MIRIVIENIVLFLLPTLFYVAYELVKRRDNPGQPASTLLDEAPLIWLMAAGAGIVFAAMLMFGSSSGGKPGQKYEPSVLKDGRIEPGRIK